MKFATDLTKGILGSADSTEMWTEVTANIPDRVLKRPNVRILVVACGHGTEAVILARRMMALGISKEQVNRSIWLIDKYQVFTNHAKLVYGFRNVITEDFLKWETDMRFDVIVGNPPYQDGTKEGGQNKIYNQICKKTLTLLKDDGIMAFVTPTSVLKKSKRFSLIDQPGLKTVNFTADEHFDVGINICSWIIDKTYKSDQVTVVNADRTTDTQSSADPIYDYTTVDKNFTQLYNKLKSLMDSPEKRMFRENNFGDAISKKKTKAYTHVLYSVNRLGEKEVFGYSKRVPFFHGKKKIVVPMTKTLTDDSILVDTDDFYVAYLCTEIRSKKEADNIKSFIQSDYFREHSEKWRNLDGYGFNYALKYLPPFDSTRAWTNKEVKQFLESFIDA